MGLAARPSIKNEKSLVTRHIQLVCCKELSLPVTLWVEVDKLRSVCATYFPIRVVCGVRFRPAVQSKGRVTKKDIRLGCDN